MPRSTERSRMAPASRLFMISTMRAAAPVRSSPRGSAIFSVMARSASGRLERGAPTQEVIRVDVAEMHERIGERRLGSTPPVADGARIGARALRADAERAAPVQPCDRTATRADGVDIDRRDGDGLGVETLPPW